MTLLTYFSHHGGRRRALLDIAATLRDRGRCETPAGGPPAPHTRRACPSVRTPARFIKSTPVGTAAGKRPQNRTRLLRRQLHHPDPLGAPALGQRDLTGGADVADPVRAGIAVHDIALAVDMHRRDGRRAWLAASCGPARSAPPAPRAREIGRPSRSMTMSTLFIGLSHRGGRMRSSGMAATLLPTGSMPYSVSALRRPSVRCDGRQRVDEREPAAERAGAAVGLVAVTDHHRMRGLDAQPRQRGFEDRGVRLDGADLEGQHELVDVTGGAERQRKPAERRTRCWRPPRS